MSAARNDLILDAAAFARVAHAGQRRKYSHRPFIIHPARVAGRVAIHPLATPEMVAAAFLHDVVEDTQFSLEDVDQRFGSIVGRLVGELTEAALGMKAPRRVRMQTNREYLATASREAKIIKLLDRIDNLQEMHGAPHEFIRVYCEESRLLGEVLRDADLELYEELLESADQLEASCSEAEAESADS